MVERPTNMAASVKGRLLALSRAQGRSFDLLLVRFALERLLYRLSISDHADRFILKGGMLVAHWLAQGARETRDMDFLGFGNPEPDTLLATFATIMDIDTGDGLIFDTAGLSAQPIREEMEYGGVRLRTTAALERTRVPVVLDIGYGDAVAAPVIALDYPSLLDMERPRIRSYPPASVLAEKFHAIVTLGLANGRMKDFHDLWAIPKAVDIPTDALIAATQTTFAQRRTPVPADRPVGLTSAMVDDPLGAQRWRAYAATLGLAGVDFGAVIEDIWTLFAPVCDRLT